MLLLLSKKRKPPGFIPWEFFFATVHKPSLTNQQRQDFGKVVRMELFGDPYGNRTHVTAVKGPCLSRLTNGPVVAGIGLEPMTYRV